MALHSLSSAGASRLVDMFRLVSGLTQWTVHDVGVDDVVYKSPSTWGTPMYVQVKSSSNWALNVIVHNTWDTVTRSGTGSASFLDLRGDINANRPTTAMLIESADNLVIYLSGVTNTGQVEYSCFLLSKYAALTADAYKGTPYFAGALSYGASSGLVYRSPGGSMWSAAGLFRAVNASGGTDMLGLSGGSLLVPLMVDGSGYRGTLKGVMQAMDDPMLGAMPQFSLGGVNYQVLPLKKLGWQGYSSSNIPDMTIAVAF